MSGPTVYGDVIMSNSVIEAGGVRGKQVRRNSRVTTDSGQQAINIVWTRTLREYEFGTMPLTGSAWHDIETIHEITEGGAYGFLLEDPKDSSVTVSTGVAVGLTSTTFQLYKRYQHAASGRYKDRKITRPRLAGFAIFNSGVSIGTFSLDVATGIVTIPSAPTAANLTWSGQFYVPVHFMDDTIDWTLIAAGATEDGRLFAGPSVVLEEIAE